MTFTKPSRSVSRVFIHCSASDNPAHDNIDVIRQWHLARKFNDVGYHFFIRKSGKLEVGRPINVIPAAQAGHNKGTIAICLHGLKDDLFTAAQFNTLRSLCREIDAAYDGKVTFHGHREVAAKECPVFDYRKVLGLDSKGRLLPPPPDKPYAPAPVKDPKPAPKPYRPSPEEYARERLEEDAARQIDPMTEDEDDNPGPGIALAIGAAIFAVGVYLLWKF